MLSRNRSNNAYEVQCNKTEVQEKDSILELKNQIEILSKRVEKLEGRNNCGSNILEKKSEPFPETKLIGDEFERNAEEIIGWLENPDASTIGVWGMPGVGKTALLEHICNQLMQDVSFSADVYWLTVSDCDTVYKWQTSIATCFGIDLSNVKDGAKRKRILRAELAKRGNIVLILDDMWHPFSRGEVAIPAGVNGGKIILTTCSLQVCRRMKCGDFTIEVGPLYSYGESLSLFAAEFKDYEKLSEEVKDVAKKIVYKCHGLPLAIITMGFRMSGEVDINEWTSVLHELDVCEQIDMKDKVFSKLQKSIYSSNDEMLLECFLSSVYYMNTDIVYYMNTDILRGSVLRSKLLAHWIEEGLLDEMGSKEKQLRKGNTIINKFVELSLLEELKECEEGSDGGSDGGSDRGSVGKRVYVHDLMKDMAIHITKENKCGMMLKSRDETPKVLGKELLSQDLVRVSLIDNCIEKIPEDMPPNCPKLKVLNLEGSPLIEVPEPFFMHMKALTFLNLSRTKIERLPNSVCNLENLRTLKLAYCKKLVHGPSLAHLQKFKVLDLWNTPNVEGHMGIENLKLLEKLNFTCMSDWSYFNSLMESWPFSSLRSYNFLFHNQETVHAGLEYDLDRVMKIVKVDFSSKKILLPRDIQYLSIVDCDSMEYMFSATIQAPFSSPHLHTLETLFIRSLPDLRGIEVLDIQQQSIVFPGLSELSINNCPKLRNLLSVRSVQQSLQCFSKMESLTLDDCKELQDLIVQSMNELEVRNFDLPNLRCLHLSKLPKLGRTVFRGLLYTSLKEISIWKCAKIKEVLLLDLLQQSQPLPNLEILEVRDCENLEVIFSSSNSSPNPILVLPKLETLELEDLPKLGCIYRGVLLCTGIDEDIDICSDIDICCPEVEGLSNAVICDTSQSTLASLPKYDANKDWWEPLKDFPEDARILSDRADECRRLEQCQGPSHSLDLEMRSGIAQGFFSSEPQPIIETDLHYGWQSSHAVGSEVQNASLMLRDPNVMFFTQGTYGDQGLPNNYHGNDEASTSGHGYGWSGSTVSPLNPNTTSAFGRSSE